MTYRELATKILTTFTDEQLDDDVTIYTSYDEFYPAVAFVQNEGDDVLRDGHFYLTIV